jgi:hypothetical protein
MHPALKAVSAATRALQGIESVLHDHRISFDSGESPDPTDANDLKFDQTIRVGSFVLRAGLLCRVDERWAAASLGIKTDPEDDDYAIDLTCYADPTGAPRWTLYFGERAINGLSAELEREFGSADVSDTQVLTIAHRIAEFCAKRLRAP